MVHSVVGIWRMVGADDHRLQRWNAVIGKVRWCLTPETSVNSRDVPDIRFRFLLAGYPAVFFYPVPAPVPAEMVPGTGYLYRIVKLFEMDGTL